MSLKPAAALLSCVMLAGCGVALDRDQARLCRLALVATAGDRGAVAVVSQREATARPTDVADPPFPAADGPIRVDGVVHGPAGTSRPVFAECTFGTGPERLALARLRTGRGAATIPQLFALNRFWLLAAGAAAADPLPVEGAAAVPRLPPGAGYPLQQALNAVPGCAVYTLIAVAYSLIYGLVGRINLAFGAFAALGGAAAVTAILMSAGRPLVVTLALAAAAAMVPAGCHGLAAAALVFRPLRRATGQQVLVATVGLALVLSEWLRLTQGPDPRWIGPLLNTPVAVARDTDFVVTTTPVALLVSVVGAAVVLALLAALRWSGFGRRWRAFRDDPGAAALFGVGVEAVFAQSFALACALAGLAGAFTVLIYGDITFGYAQVIGLKALTAAVVGGIGSVPGAVLGGLSIGLVESGWSAFFPIADRDLVVFCILIATLVWRPGGFLGDRDLAPRRV